MKNIKLIVLMCLISTAAFADQEVIDLLKSRCQQGDNQACSMFMQYSYQNSDTYRMEQASKGLMDMAERIHRISPPTPLQFDCNSSNGYCQ